MSEGNRWMWIFIGGVVVFSILLLLGECNAKPERGGEDVAVIDTTYFRPIEGRDDLMYDEQTKVIFYMFNTYEQHGYQGFGDGHMTPYLSENLRYCKYIDGQIVEYIPEEPAG